MVSFNRSSCWAIFHGSLGADHINRRHDALDIGHAFVLISIDKTVGFHSSGLFAVPFPSMAKHLICRGSVMINEESQGV